jgi:methylglutaconyl-CoA hydratase
VCDVVVAAEGLLLGTTEVRLGIIPAVISPYVVRKIGESAARLWFTTGDRFDAREGLRVGLVHKVVPEDALDAEVEKVVASLLSGGPEAIGVAKRLAQTVGTQPLAEAIPETVRLIAERRVSPEGQEGMTSFLEKRAPDFAKGAA